MRVRVPDYFDGFSCLAGACPHSCCIGWEVVLDEDTVRRYQQLPGALGERLRDAMALDGEDVCFPLDGRRCPFLNQENLCDIHCALGPEATSVTCQEHPRFIEDYGPFQEITLSADCPKANELLLGTRPSAGPPAGSPAGPEPSLKGPSAGLPAHHRGGPTAIGQRKHGGAGRLLHGILGDFYENRCRFRFVGSCRLPVLTRSGNSGT